MQHGPLVIAAASLGAALLFGHVARTALGRSREHVDRAAHMALACAWGGFAFMAANDAARILLGTYWPERFDLYSNLVRLKIVANGVMIWGLGVYVAHLWFGHARGWRVNLATFAAAHVLFFLYAYQVRHAVAATSGDWVPRLVFDGPHVLPPLLASFALAFYFIPPLVLVILLGAKGRTLADPTARHRVHATGIAIASFQVANMHHSNPQISGDSGLFPVLAALTLLSGAIAVLAHGAGAVRPLGMGRDVRPEPPAGLAEAQASTNLGDTLK